MALSFVNRSRELRELDTLSEKGGMVVLYGRRRVGKTRLLVHWLKGKNGFYTQAIEGGRDLQIQQIVQDIGAALPVEVRPKDWQEVFALLDLQPTPGILCIDEFPYLVQSDPTLPSFLQRWLDHRKHRNPFLILCGSSRRMMHGLFLNPSAPLYGRAQKVLSIGPMGYFEFCKACGLAAGDENSFLRFSMVGGIPRYWEFIQRRRDPIQTADELYFGFAPYMENEPRRILSDEQITGIHPVSILEAVGRGAEKPSEIAARLEIPQTQLSKVFSLLIDADILQRETPFGESERNPKNVLYKIQDPSLRFWYRVYSSHRSRWHQYSRAEKSRLLHLHASSVFEDYCRSRYPGSKKYWEKDNEWDLVQENDSPRNAGKTLVVGEVKFKRLTIAEKTGLLRSMESRWTKTKLSVHWPRVRFEVLDLSILSAPDRPV
jgi:AAA+ ATPase superfamily predicted ATPase